ncbi:hypothetical protein Tco_0870859 [Tanacetum coccineum]
MTRSSTKELLSPFENPEQKFRSRRRLFDTPSIVELNSPEFDDIFDIEEQSEEQVREIMTETMEQYMSKTRGDYGSGVTMPTINQDTHFELKGQFLKELRDNTFSGSEHKDVNEHIEKVINGDLFLHHLARIAARVSLLGAGSKRNVVYIDVANTALKSNRLVCYPVLGDYGGNSHERISVLIRMIGVWTKIGRRDGDTI